MHDGYQKQDLLNLVLVFSILKISANIIMLSIAFFLTFQMKSAEETLNLIFP